MIFGQFFERFQGQFLNDFLETFAVAVSLTDICLHFTIYLESFGKEHLKNWHRKLEFAKWIWPWCLLSSSDFSNASCGQIYTSEVSKTKLIFDIKRFLKSLQIKKHSFFQNITDADPQIKKATRVQKYICSTEDGMSMTTFYYYPVNHQSGLQRNTLSKLLYILLIHQNVRQIIPFHLRYMQRCSQRGG